MITTNFTKTIGAGAALGLVALVGMLLISPSRGRADDPDNEQSKIQIGFAVAPVPLNLNGKNRDLVGLGSYIVNAANDCNFCHSAGGPPNFNFAAGGNPYFGQHPKKTDPTTYLAGGTDFGPALPGPGYLGPDIISRNLTPDKRRTLEEASLSSCDLCGPEIGTDHLHPTCTSTSPPTPVNCIPAPVDGALLHHATSA